jgi:hypothetical protein
MAEIPGVKTSSEMAQICSGPDKIEKIIMIA